METKLLANMTKNLITVGEESNLTEAYSLMIKNGIRHLPVTNQSGHITGMLSERDLQRAMKSDVQGEGYFRRESCEFNQDDRVMDYMSWPVKTVEHDTHLRIVTGKMIREKVSAYLVTDRGTIKGIITSEDLLKVLEGLLEEPGSGLKLGLENLLLNPTIGQFAQTISNTGI